MSDRSIGPDVVRRVVDARSNYADYRPELREDFWFSCAYCSIAESEARGVGFEIDHYLPVKFHDELKCAYTNLMWACIPCNRFKHDNPSDADLAKGLEILRPDQHVFREHLEFDDTHVTGRTLAGKYTVALLLLNRAPLVVLRKLRHRLRYARDLIFLGLRHLARARIDRIPPAQRRLLVRRRNALGATGEELERAWREELRRTLASPLLDAVDPGIAARRREELKVLRSTLL